VTCDRGYVDHNIRIYTAVNGKFNSQDIKFTTVYKIEGFLFFTGRKISKILRGKKVKAYPCTYPFSDKQSLIVMILFKIDIKEPIKKTKRAVRYRKTTKREKATKIK